jgi:hypothetical protein
MFVNTTEGHVGSIHNRHPESLNKHPAYEYNINYGEKDVEAVNLVEKVELSSEKQYVQSQPLVPTTPPVEEHPPPLPP